VQVVVQVALLIAAVASALANWWSRLKDNTRVEAWSKPLTTVLVIGLALVSGAPTAQIATAVAALVLCLLGDVALMPAVDKFVVGLACFLLGHLVFIVLFAEYGMGTWWLGGAAGVFALVLVASAGRRIVSAATARDGGLRLPVVAYLTVISSMAVCGWATGQPWVVAGTTLFVISDALLGWRQFVRPHGWMGPAVMITYHGAIASLALSLW
jgi:uncharacterized membrane protein YhhN